jgi:hypothetical protein
MICRAMLIAMALACAQTPISYVASVRQNNSGETAPAGRGSIYLDESPRLETEPRLAGAVQTDFSRGRPVRTIRTAMREHAGKLSP